MPKEKDSSRKVGEIMLKTKKMAQLLKFDIILTWQKESGRPSSRSRGLA